MSAELEAAKATIDSHNETVKADLAGMLPVLKSDLDEFFAKADSLIAMDNPGISSIKASASAIKLHVQMMMPGVEAHLTSTPTPTP